ncbi:sulfite exporter TauE/SafE family protein [Ponticaulis sp.]|uniref:sulfite exporter TauE/SafE family protein n=1 Tax=Ponticaulis sp. TaxID=2020902 RepID=UPI0025D4498E|nr:sulfite exporter TauE/SafE family protein [Ponticaulis sp.]|tara:strand:+ start:50044 stop:50832 length:789 start_codon:yes stop_codon:yes gene_type:complete
MIELTLYVILTALASGIIIGIFLSTFGGGGSVLAAPLLLYFVGLTDPHLAIGTSALSVAITAFMSMLGHWKGGRVKWPCALVFGSFGLIGSIIGSSVAKVIDGDALLLAFAIAMLAIGLSMFRKSTTVGDASVQINWFYARRLMPLGLLVGFAAGFFGIGGGFLIVPGLMLATGMPITLASASSLVSVTIFGIATAGNYALAGWVDWRLAGLLVAGGFLGGLVGQRIAKLLTNRIALARNGFAALICVVAVYVGWQAVSAFV